VQRWEERYAARHPNDINFDPQKDAGVNTDHPMTKLLQFVSLANRNDVDWYSN
jgi:hypothetical protein